MTRRRNDPDGADIAMKILQIAPWYFGPLTAVFIYAMLAWFFPWMWPMLTDGEALKNRSATDVILATWAGLGRSCAPFVAGFVLFIWCLVEATKILKRRQFDSLRGLKAVRHLDWQQFEELLCEVFRRQGYSVSHTGRAEADGGIDIRLVKGKQLSLVQCKHWKAWQVPVNVIRELLGVVTSEKAEWGIVVTSGTFSNDAIEFAAKNHIQLIDGDELWPLIQSVQPVQRISDQVEQRASAGKMNCPKCGREMELKTARKGPNPGSQFYGCPNWPRCNGKRPC